MQNHPSPRWIPLDILPTWAEKVDAYDAEGRMVSTRITDPPAEPSAGPDPPPHPEAPRAAN